MSGKNQKQDRLKKTYSYPEFLREFFPNIKPEQEIEEITPVMTKEQFFDILKQVTNVTTVPPDLETLKTSE